ncbi:PqiB family protein [Neoroseomonas lacus]|uniref:Paraquat-inducible protein B n=1 Tax=Neoroseomonas lacus TaxID=287609 RepID=A0A917KIE0_9PROT|nr:MlaD family protein [Neoroseomonas lacus]GGJ12832.1 paraquat-inducible protein B [Neoroseomonas lacus]
MVLDHPEARVTTAKVGRSRRLSPIWAIPIVTVLIAGFLVWHTYSQRGPTITITFRGAEGLTAGQSQLRYRDVVMGTVQEIVLSQDLQHVTMTVRTTRAAEPLLTENTRFWVVKPRLFAGSISGLDTLLSGSYIQMAPALTASGEHTRHFIGLEDPPLLTAEEPGRSILLRADRIGSISLGSPIFYRDLDVGQVMGWDLSDMAESVTIHAFIRAPFDRYVREGSRFWNASGVSVKMGAEGIQLQVESLRALLLGGIAFETPEAARNGRQIQNDATFRLYATQDAANSAAITRRVPVVSYFTDSISGLAPGAPVTFQGVRIGEVLGYDLVYDATTQRLRVPVRYEIEPERVAGSINAQGRTALENARLLVQQGMRARLMSSNLITGQQQIALEMIENPPPAEITMQGNVIVMPSVPGQFASIMEGVNRVLTSIEGMPWADIGRNVDSTVAGVNELIRGPELRQSLAGLNSTLTAAEEMIRHIDAAAQPALRGLPQMMANLNATVVQANRLVASANRGYGEDSQFQRDLERMLEQITVAARSLRSLVDQLNRNPESLIRGRSTQGP